MFECPHCHGEKRFKDLHEQGCDAEGCSCSRAEVTCWTCEGDGVVSNVQIAVFRARGGPGPVPFWGFA